MREILPGVFHWTAFHEPIAAQVSSYYLHPAGIAIDPKVPEGGLDELPGEPQQVVLTSGLHDRDAREFAEAFDIPIRASDAAAQRLGDTLDVAPFAERDEIAPGAVALHVGALCADEEALHLATGDGGALALADALHRYGGELAFFDDDLLGDDPERVKRGLTDAFGDLLELDFDHLLLAHGDPIVGTGKTALREFVERSP